MDELVHFRHKGVIIYPNDEKKPPVGEGLNRKAQITLHRIWPYDIQLHQPIKDRERLEKIHYEAKLRSVSDTRFVGYQPETGSWVFIVHHFSRYGLSDAQPSPSTKRSNVSTSQNPQNEDEYDDDDPDFQDDDNDDEDDKNSREFQCVICEKSFRRKYQLKKHEERMHSMNVKRFVCPICARALQKEAQKLKWNNLKSW